jgi:hypothetical protein
MSPTQWYAQSERPNTLNSVDGAFASQDAPGKPRPGKPRIEQRRASPDAPFVQQERGLCRLTRHQPGAYIPLQRSWVL